VPCTRQRYLSGVRDTFSAMRIGYARVSTRDRDTRTTQKALKPLKPQHHADAPPSPATANPPRQQLITARMNCSIIARVLPDAVLNDTHVASMHRR
jgi:hypothetical protein